MVYKKKEVVEEVEEVEPEPIEEVVVEPVKEVKAVKDKDILEFANGAKYKVAGVCLQCGNKVYQCKTHPLRDEALDARWAAVYVPGASMMGGGVKEEPQLYCQAHDPTRSMRREGMRPGDIMSGDVWSPQR